MPERYIVKKIAGSYAVFDTHNDRIVTTHSHKEMAQNACGLAQGLYEANIGETHPIETLWDDDDDE